MLGAGYAGEGSTSYIFKTQLKKAEEKSRQSPVNNSPPTTTDGADQTLIILVEGAHQKTIGKAREVLCTSCHQELSIMHMLPKTNGPQATEEETDSVSRQLQRENERKMRNRIRKKLFAARLPGTILGTALAAVFSTELFIKISTAVTVVSYNLFFWMGARCYDLGEIENYDKKDEKQILVVVFEILVVFVSELRKAVAELYQLLSWLLAIAATVLKFKPTLHENKSGEMEKQDQKDEEKIDGKDEKQNPDALVPELKKAVEAILKLLPLWLTFASTSYVVNATADSFFMEQVDDYLENNTKSFKIPKSVFYAFPEIVSIITGQVVERFYDEKKEERWARLLRISIGMLFSSLCCIVASLVAYRLDSNYNSASMLWLLPQFLLWGMMKGILEEGFEEFLHDHLDNDLQVLAVCGIADAVGSFLSMLLTAASPSTWVGSGNDISKSNLGNYYRMLAIVTLSSTLVFTIVAIAYELRKKEDTGKCGKKY